jgi:hypothetical protein
MAATGKLHITYCWAKNCNIFSSDSCFCDMHATDPANPYALVQNEVAISGKLQKKLFVE